jgi:5'-methylthioadenosine phosphorylase
MTPKLGLIVNDVCQVDDSFNEGEEKDVVTPHGAVKVRLLEKWLVVCRSGFDGSYRMPHEYNTVAYLSAIVELGVKEVVGLHSAGSLRPSLNPGTLVIPDDWINIGSHVTTISGQRRYLTPSFCVRVRQNLAAAAWKAEVKFENSGIYWQTTGPRLETKAEIKVMSNFADLVGMGLAQEASLAQEMGLDYAAICSVDNYANGLATPLLTDEMILQQSRKNAGAVVRVLAQY